MKYNGHNRLLGFTQNQWLSLMQHKEEVQQVR